MLELLFVAAAAAPQATTLSLGGLQFFFIVILVFAVIGLLRGWRRGIVSFGFEMVALLLLFIDQGRWLADFLFNKLPEISQLIAGNTTNTGTSNVSDTNLVITKLIVLALMIVIGYFVGNKAFPKPATPPDRLFGILPAIVGGYFMVFYLTNYLGTSTSSSQLSVDIGTPSQDTVGNSVLIIFIIAVVVVIAALIAANAKKAKK